MWQAIFALAEVVGLPEHDPSRERWAWRFAIRPLVVVPDLHDAPAAEEAGIWPQSLWRHSHIRLTEEQFAEARRLVEAAARPVPPLQQTVAKSHVPRLKRSTKGRSA